MNTTIVIQLITGALGSVGFGILFHMKKKYLPLAAAGGFISWMVFLLGKGLWGNVFLPSLLAGFIVDVYAEILARICKETSTSFFVTSVIPLIPGSTLYYCMNSIVEGNTVQALEYGRDTFLFAFGIAAGMSIAWAICYFTQKYKEETRIRLRSLSGDCGCFIILFSKIINRRVWRQGKDDLAVFYCLCGTFTFLGSAINSEIAVQEFF